MNPFAAFPATALGFTTGRIGWLSNIGNAPLTVESVSSNSSEFVVSHACTVVLPGEACGIRVGYTPTAAGTRTGTLTVKTSADDSAKTYSLQGTTQLGVISITPTSVDFGEKAPGTTTEQQFTLTNLGTGPTTLSFSGLTAPMSVARYTCNSTLAAKASCTFKVFFQPTTATAVTQTLRVEGSLGVTARTVAVAGAGAVNLVISENTFDYNIATKYTALYGAPVGPTRIVLLVQPGVVVTQRTALASIYTGALPNGSIVTLVNKGHIVGKAGAGGNGGSGNAGKPGAPGGDAIGMTVDMKIDNSLGYIWGAGGAYGGSRGCGSVGCGFDGSSTTFSLVYNAPGANGGGGLGNTNGNGGRGGGYGVAGTAGTTGYDNRFAGGAGGAAGAAVRRNGKNLTWISSGASGQVRGFFFGEVLRRVQPLVGVVQHSQRLCQHARSYDRARLREQASFDGIDHRTCARRTKLLCKGVQWGQPGLHAGGRAQRH